MKRFNQIAIAFFALSLATAGAAAAEPVPTGDDHVLGIGVMAGGGLIGFTDDTANDLVGTGGTWEVRGIIGVDSPIAVEAAYVGSNQAVDMPFSDPSIVGNGIEGAVRVNVGTYDVQPYVVGGAGWTHYSLRTDDMIVEIEGDDDVLTLPAGAGVSFYAGPALIDLRGTYRFAFDDELLREEGDLEDRESLDTWAATARVGLAF